jgi:hypothetical protein
MKSISSPILLSLLVLLPPSVLAYDCSAANAVTPESLASSGGGGSSDNFNQVLQSGGCSFLVASGAGTCTTTSGYKRSIAENDAAAAVSKRTPTIMSVLPCLDRMTCLIIETSHLYCVDLANLDYIDETGGCGNLNTKKYEDGCVQNWASSASTTSTTGSTRSTSKAQAQSNVGAATRLDSVILAAVGLVAGVVSYL